MTHQSPITNHLALLSEAPQVDLTNSFAGAIAAAAIELAGTEWAKKNSAVIAEALRIDATGN